MTRGVELDLGAQMLPAAMLFLLLMVGLHGVAPMFHEGYEYDYYFTAETEIMSMDNLTTQIQLTLTPVHSPEFTTTIVRLKLNEVTQFSLLHTDHRVLENDMIKLPFYMSVCDTGLVDQVYVHPAEIEDILVLKKSIAAAFSHRKQVGQGAAWSYSGVEDDHMGSNHHHYEGEQTATGYNLRRSHTSDDDFGRQHTRQIRLDSSGHIHTIDDQEEVIVHSGEDKVMASPITTDANNGMEAKCMQFTIKWKARIRSSSSIEFQDKRSVPSVPLITNEQLSMMKASVLNMKHQGWRKDIPGTEVFPKVNKLLQCTNKYEHADRRRVDCVGELMQLLYHVRQADLSRWAKNILNRPCQKGDINCSKARETLINVIGQVKSPEAQRLIVNEVVRKNPDEDELKRAIFHLGSQDKPIQETFDAVQELCFGKHFENHGLHSVTPNQRRGCLALGSVLRVHEDRKSVASMIHHLHTWLDNKMNNDFPTSRSSDVKEKHARSEYIHTKHVLLETLANAAHPSSRPLLMKYAAPNYGHDGWRHAALGGLKHYHDQDAATALLNTTMTDGQLNVRAVALRHYKEHPHGFNFQQDDAVILDRFNVSVSPHRSMSRRSAGQMCNLLELLTIDKEWGIPSYEWKKGVGNDMFGAEFGVAFINKMHLHISPIAGFFEAESFNTLYFRAWVNMIVKFKKDIMLAEACYRGDMRFWNISFVKDFAKDKMSFLSRGLDLHLEKYADDIARGVNAFNNLLGTWDIPSFGLFDLDMSTPSAFIKKIVDEIENAFDINWRDTAHDALKSLIDKAGIDMEELRGMFSNSKEWAKQQLTKKLEEFFGKEWDRILESVKMVKQILNDELGDLDFNLDIFDKILSEMALSDFFDDARAFANELVSRVKASISGSPDRENGLMGQINQLLRASRDLPKKLDNIRHAINNFKDMMLDIEGLDWANDIQDIVQRLRYFTEDNSANILNFFQQVIDTNSISLPFISQMMEAANNFITIGADGLTMSPQQAINDILRAVRQIKAALWTFICGKKDLTDANADSSGKLDSFMKLGGDPDRLKMDMDRAIRRMNAMVTSLRKQGIQKHLPTLQADVNNRRGLAEKISMKLMEVESAEESLHFLQEIREDVFDLNYVIDSYQDGFERVLQSLEEAEERFEDIQHSVSKTKEFVHEVFGIKFHPAFPNNVRDKCDEKCECGMYPSHMYGRVGVQLMINEGDQVVCPVDGYVLVGKERHGELVIRPVDEDLEDFEIIISHVVPDDYVLDIEQDEEEYGQLMEAGAIIGYATEAPCNPNFIFVCQREIATDGDDVPETEKPECGVLGAKCMKTYYPPVEEYNGKPLPQPNLEMRCSHTEFKHILRTVDVVSFAQNFRKKLTELKRKTIDMSKKLVEKTASAIHSLPKLLDPKNMEKMMGSVNDKIRSFPKKASRFLSEKVYKKTYTWINGLKVPKISLSGINRKCPKISNFLDLNKMRVSDLMDHLQAMGLQDKVLQLKDMAQDMYKKLHQKIRDHPFKSSPSEIRNKMKQLGEKLAGSSLVDLSTKVFENIKECGNGLVLGMGSICEVQDACQNLICSIKAKISHFINRLSFSFYHDECTREIWITVNDHEIYINYTGVEKQSIQKIIEWNPKNMYGNLTIDAGYELNDKENALIFNLSLTPCVPWKKSVHCSPPTEVMKKLHIPVDFEIVNCKPTTSNPITVPDLSELLNSTTKYFTYMMDRLGQDKTNMTQLMNELRTTAAQGLMEKTTLNTSIDREEIHNPQDVETMDTKQIGRFDITFFRLPFVFPLIPLIFKVEVGAGGVIGVNFKYDIKVMSSESTLTLDPWVAGTAWGDGSATIVGMGGGMKLTGYILETHFPFTMLFEYEKFPLKVTKTFDVELIPLRCEFQGYIKMLFVEIPFTIFDWSASSIKWNILTEVEYIKDGSAPDFLGDCPEESRAKRGLSSNKCHIEQMIGRHPSDAAFRLEAPFFDAESELDVVYAVGTFPGGENVLDWEKMTGPVLTNVIQLKQTGIPLHWTVKAKNTQGLETVSQCSIQSYDVTIPIGRMEADYMKTSHPNKLSASMIVIDDSTLVDEQYVAVGVGEHYYGHSEVDWHQFELEKNPTNKGASGPLEHFAASRTGKLTSTPFRTSTERQDRDCAQACLDSVEKCVSFDYEYLTDICDLHTVIQGPGVHLRLSSSYRNFERLGSGHSAWFSYDDLPLIHGEVYYINTKITNNLAYTNYLTSVGGIIVDFTPPEPGPVGDFSLDIIKHDGCDAAFNHKERCVDVTPNDNHRWIIDGPGGRTVFNGNWPKRDMKYTFSNHYFCGNWDGFHDDETDLWAFTWSAGRRVCDSDVVDYEDPHSHLADKSYWNHQGYASGLVLREGAHYVTVQSLNDIVHGGALVTTVCHHVPLIIDLSPPFLEIVEDVFLDEDFDILAIYYKAYDPESGILRADFALGETQHDAFIRRYSRHEPTFDGYEMITVDDVDLPHGILIWIRVRPVNNVELMTAGHGKQPIMIDHSPPVAGEVLDGDQLYDRDYQPYDHKMCAQWIKWFDPESGIHSYQWAIGSEPGLSDIMDWQTYDHWHRGDCVEVSLNHSEKYYNVIRAYNYALNSRSTNMSSDGIVVDMTDPVAGFVNDGFERPYDMEYTYKQATVQAYWADFYDPESGIEKFDVTVDVNSQEARHLERRGVFEELEDHTFHLRHNDFVEVTVKATDGATRTNSSQSSGYRVDLTPPDLRFLKDNTNGYDYTPINTEMYAKWKYQDIESGIKEYRVLIYQHQGGIVSRFWPINDYWEVYDPHDEDDNEVETTITGLNMKNGRKYSLEVTALNGAKLSSRHQTHGMIVDTTPPVMKNVFIGFYGADEDLNDDKEVIQADPETVHASWLGYDHESDILKFMVAVGKFPGDSSATMGFLDYGTEISGYIRDLDLNVTVETGDVYYVSVKAMNGAGVWSDVVSSRPIHVYGANVPGTVLDGRKADEDENFQQDVTSVGITFEGFDSPACGIRSYEWALGSEPGWSDIMPYTPVGIVMMNDTHGQAQAHMHLHHDELMYASVRAHTGHSCHEAIIHSSSDGSTVDTEPPHIVLTALGLFGMDNDTEEILTELAGHVTLYQSQYDSIDLRWNATDDTSDVANITWMAGRLPLEDDTHAETHIEDSQIPLMSVVMMNGETVVFSVQATDHAGNKATLISPPLTIDTTLPIISDFACTKYLSKARSLLTCQWESTLDEESPLTELIIGLGTEQQEENMVPFHQVKLTERTWTTLLPDRLFDTVNGSCFVSLLVDNMVQEQAGAYFEVILDNTPPIPGSAVITTTESLSEVPETRVCQRSITTMAVEFEGFFDPDTEIESFEVAVGSYDGGADIMDFRPVNGTAVTLDKLALIPGEQAFATVKAINRAGLHSNVASRGVHISPFPSVSVLDGLENEDIDFQNDGSSISGQVFLSHPCPIVYGEWSIHNLLGDTIVEATQFYHNRFENDELRLDNEQTYYVTVELMDALNRTFRGRSNGVTIYIQPPEPGAVRDGPHQGEDRNYQQSTSELSVNWDDFGNEDIPGERIEYYEVALGDNPAYPNTRSNTHFFINVGLEKNYTFTSLRLIEKTVTYYSTVRAHAESGAYTDATSNGIKAGFTPGMLSGTVELASFINSSSSLSVSWDGFVSSFRIIHYGWGISSQPLSDNNITVPCRDYLPHVKKHFDVLKLQDAKENTVVTRNFLNLQHNTVYYVSVIAEDEPGQCIAAPSESVLVDLTPPTAGQIILSGISKQVQYILDPNVLIVRWDDFQDQESGIDKFYIQLFQGDACNDGEIGDDHHFEPFSPPIDVMNETEVKFYDYFFDEGRPYRVIIHVTNNAGSEILKVSTPFFVDTSPAVQGQVKDGVNWKTSAMYQPYTDKVFGTIAVSPLGTGLHCPTQRNMLSMKSFNETWTILDHYDVYSYNDRQHKVVEYQNWNVKIHPLEEEDRFDAYLTFHRNISLNNMEGGALVSETVDVHEGQFSLSLQAPRGDNTVHSVTFSEGFLDEYTSFEMINYTDRLSDEEFGRVAQGGDLDWDWKPSNDTDDLQTTTTEPTPPPQSTNGSKPIFVPTDVHPTNGFGLHFMGHAFGEASSVWYMMLWVRVHKQIYQDWILLDFDPAEEEHDYDIKIRQDPGSIEALWNMMLFVDGTFRSEITGIELPHELSIKMRTWSHDAYLPYIDDPFNPFTSESIISKLLVPLPLDKMCHYGDAFYDMESGVGEIFIGLGNSTEMEDNVVPFHKVQSLCHPCIYRCDYYKCQENCTTVDELDEGLQIFNLEINNIHLHPGDHKPLLRESVLDFDWDVSHEFEDESNQTFFDAIHYRFLVKVINEAGLVTYATSPGIILDPFPPVPVCVVAVDPEFDMTLPATHQGHVDSLAAWWEFDEPESYITQYKVAVGTMPNGTDLLDWTTLIDQQEMLLDNLNLKEHVKYYFTVEATNAAGLKSVAHTDGITVKLGTPDVENVIVALPGVDMNDVIVDENGNHVYFNPTVNSVALSIGGNLPADTLFIEWSIGLSEDDTFLMRPIAVTPKDAVLMEIKQGFYWYRDIMTRFSLRESGVRSLAESNATDHWDMNEAGRMKLEPGTCIYNHVNAMNLAHQRTPIPIDAMCVKGPHDESVKLSDGSFELNFKRDENEGKVIGQGLSGDLTLSVLNRKDLEKTYEISSNISYIPVVVNPDVTSNLTSRILFNRLIYNSGRAIVLSPTTKARVEGPLEIHMSFDGVPIEVGQSVAIIYWDRAGRMSVWRQISESCGIDEQVDYNSKLIKGSYCGKQNNQVNQNNHFNQNNLYDIEHTLFVLYVIDSSFHNSAPYLTISEAETTFNSLLVYQLQYQDAEGDEVSFSLQNSAEITGLANITTSGELMYLPERWYFGADMLKVTLQEVNLPPFIAPNTANEPFHIHVTEPHFFPQLYLYTKDRLDVSAKLHSAHTSISLEANTTHNDIGLLYLCDVNSKDKIDILYTSSDGNVTYDFQEVGGTRPAEADNELMDICLDLNLRIFKIKSNKSEDYHGSDELVLIGQDDSVLYSQPLVVDVHTMISPCVHGHCIGKNNDADCDSTDRVHSYQGYGCACDRRYRGTYCNQSHLLPFEIILIIMATASLTSLVVFLAVKQNRRRRKVVPVVNPEGMEMEEVSEYETDTESSEEEEEIPRDLNVIIGTGGAKRRHKKDFKSEVHQNWFATPEYANGAEMAEIDV